MLCGALKPSFLHQTKGFVRFENGQNRNERLGAVMTGAAAFLLAANGRSLPGVTPCTGAQGPMNSSKRNVT
jgi:hypothetical protein